MSPQGSGACAQAASPSGRHPDIIMKKPMHQDKQPPLPLPGTEPGELFRLVLKFAGAIGIALALATWVNRLLAQI
jgi:hypothetical protein